MRRAFTLLEVTVALAVFALMAVALLGAVFNVQEAMLHARADGGGHGEALQLVMRRVLSATARDAAQAGGSMTIASGGAVSWTVGLADTTLPDLHHAVIELVWDDDTAETFTLWVYRPEWSDPATRSSLLQEMRTAYPSSRLSTY
jgi:prepilin-type N-terminal cleavage/methylation domain-containing protein